MNLVVFFPIFFGLYIINWFPREIIKEQHLSFQTKKRNSSYKYELYEKIKSIEILKPFATCIFSFLCITTQSLKSQKWNFRWVFWNMKKYLDEIVILEISSRTIGLLFIVYLDKSTWQFLRIQMWGLYV